MVRDGALSHKIDYDIILNVEGHLNCITGSKVMAILLNGWILTTGGDASGRICACRFVFLLLHVFFTTLGPRPI